MQDIAISPQLNHLPNNSIATASAGTANTFNASSENFSMIMEREVSNYAAYYQPDVTAAIKDSATNNGVNSQPFLINAISGKLLQHLSINQDASAANSVDLPFNDTQTDFIDSTFVTSAIEIDQTFTHNNFNQSHVSEYLAEESENTANFTAAAQILPPFVEAYGNHTISIFQASVISPTSNTAQPTTTENAPFFVSPGYQSLTQYNINQNNVSEYLSEQSDNSANFAAANRNLPPLVEENNINTLSVFQASVNSAKFHTVQQNMTENTTIFAPSAPPSSVLPTVYIPSEITLDSQFGQPQWGDELSQKIVWLVGQQQQTAEIRLNPAHLGPIEIMLNITNDQGIQATAQFVSSHLVVREAIEAALPKLREMMAENGITLGNVTVDSNSSQQQRNQTHHESFTTKYLNNPVRENFDSFDEAKTIITTSTHAGMVNTFA